MKILVVGGCGYVGGAVTDILIKKKNDFTVYDNLLYEDKYLKKNKFIFGDIRDNEKLNKLYKEFDCVIWIAALVGDGACNINPSLTYNLNYKSVQNLSKNFDGRIIFFSTCSVYGAQEGTLYENSKTNPLSLYASTKLKAEGELMSKNSIIFRLGTLFGLSDEFSRIRMDLVVNTLTVKAHIENKIEIFGGEQFRPLLHVKDAAYAIYKSIDSDVRGIFNLSYDNFKIIDLAQKIKKFYSNLNIIITDIPFQDARNYKVDNTRVREKLGFEAKISVEEGIEEIKNLIVENRIKDVFDTRYTNQKFLVGKL
jgi:nucleoside-diphosphate-sugar epimerase